jgi:hypothetical protein
MGPSEAEKPSVAGRYVLEQLIGRGGQGEVWCATDRITGDRVGLKLLDRRGEDTSAARARREVATLRILRVPGVVRLLDEGVDGERAFVVMDLVEGTPFPGKASSQHWAEIAPTTMRLLEILARVHAAGVVHRDLKPANVLVGATGEPTLLDFGLSRNVAQALTTDLTLDGQFLGTPAYIAPEQIDGGRVTPRTDLYAVGVMLYEALSGRRPHEGGVRAVLRARVTSRPQRLRDVAPAVPTAVAELVDALLAIDPSDRPSSALDVLGRLSDRPTSSGALPRLGPLASLEAVLERARAGRSVDVVGPVGSGRSRLIEEAARALEAGSRTVVRALASDLPLGSLEAVVGPADPGARLVEVVERAKHILRERLSAGCVLVVDDVEALDRTSARIVEDCLDAGAVLRATEEPSARAVTLAPLTEEELRPLFAVPDRLLHMREDAARALWERTRGLPGRVVRELGSWIDEGICRADGERFVLDREGLYRLEAGPRLAPMNVRGGAVKALPEHLAEVLSWSVLAAPQRDIDLLCTVMERPRWHLEAELSDLEARGLGRYSADGGFEATSAALELWSSAQLQRVHRKLADALPLGATGRLRHLVAVAADDEVAHAVAIAREASALGERYAREGALAKAVMAIAEGVRALRHTAPSSMLELGDLLTQWTIVALIEETPRSLDQVLYEICRTIPRSSGLEDLEQLVRAALAADEWSDRALEMLDRIPPFADNRLERRRQGLRIKVSRRCSPDKGRQVIEEVTRWALETDDAESRAAFAGWLGRLRYREGRFYESARLHAECAERQAWPTERIAAQLNGASALMEAFRHEEAAALARAAGELARTCRHPFLEGRAEWVVRSADYRLGRATVPDLELVEAASLVGAPDSIEAPIRRNEAAVAWRAGDLELARELATAAWVISGRSGESMGATLLAAGLAVACGQEVSAGELTALAERARVSASPGVGLQVVALLASRHGLPRPSNDSLLRMADDVPRNHWSQRMDILSIRESLKMLDVPDPHQR